MQRVKLHSNVVEQARLGADRWYVTTGSSAVGPVNLDLLARGVEAGKVPLEAFVRHEGWRVWRPLTELAVITGDEGAPASLPSNDDVASCGRPSAPTAFLPDA